MNSRIFGVLVGALAFTLTAVGVFPAQAVTPAHKADSSPLSPLTASGKTDGVFSLSGDAVLINDEVSLEMVGSLQPRKGMKIRFTVPTYGVATKARIGKQGQWEAGATFATDPANPPSLLKVHATIRKNGMKKPVAQFTYEIPVRAEYQPEPIPDEFFGPTSEEVAERGGDASAYRFSVLMPGNGQPVRWNRCAPINVIIDSTGLPETATSDIVAAFAELSRASGLSFTEPQFRDLPPVTGTGDIMHIDGAITITAATPQEVADLEGNTLGVGGFKYRGKHIAAGYVTIDVSEPLTPGFDANRPSLGRLLLHELGHAINLGHIDNPGQMMHPYLENIGPVTYQAGDIAGMNGLASFGCE